MKTGTKIKIGGLLAALTLLAGASHADNACIEHGPYTNLVGCISGTWVQGGLTPTNIIIGVGQTVVPPTFYGYAVTNGMQQFFVSNDCPNTGPNYYFTNQTAYAFSNYFVPAIPSIFWTSGTYSYTGMVVAIGSPCSPLNSTVGTVYYNISSNNPDVLLDVDFCGRTNSAMAGYAVIGDGVGDYWNCYAKTNQASSSLANLKTAEGLVSPVGLLVTNLPTVGTNGSADAMYKDYLKTNSATASITITNLPGGTWNIFLYSQDGNFTLSTGATSYGTQTCYDGSPNAAPLAWKQGVQYVEFQNVVLTNGQPLTITINPGINGATIISGMQIASLNHQPPPPFSMPSGIAAWWPAEGNAKDAIGGTTGIVYSVTSYVPGVIGQAFNFDGINSCAMNTVTPPLTSIQNTFTIDFWANPQKGISLPPQDATTIAGTSGQNYAVFPDFGGYYGPAGAGVSVGTNGIAVIEHAAYYMPSLLTYTNQLSGWVHVAVVYVNKQPTLYVNGANVRTGLTSGESFVYPSKNLGGNSTSPWNSFGPYKGSLDEIHIFNRALSAGEIAAIYNNGVIGGIINPMQDSDYDGVSDLQELADRTNPNDANSAPQIQLSYLPFDNTNTWAGSAGQLPLLATNMVGVPSWATNAVLIDSPTNAILTYRDVETNGNANINLRNGTIRFWFKPDWSSTNAGGVGPGSYGRMIEMGTNNPFLNTNSWIVGSLKGWWSLYFSADGSQLVFGSSTNGFSSVNLSVNISWVTNVWHQIVLTYGPTNSVLYLDGQPATNGMGSIYFPNSIERSAGFRLGSDPNGNNQARGDFDELETFNYQLSAAVINANYQAAMNLDSNGDGLSNLLENQLGLNPYGLNSSNGLSSFNGLQVFTPLK